MVVTYLLHLEERDLVMMVNNVYIQHAPANESSRIC